MSKSVNGKVWQQVSLDENYVAKLTRDFGISDIIARIISNRVKNIDDVANFITPKIRNSLPNPFHLKDMDEGIKRTIQAIYNSEKICIFADYDVDGATSAALLSNVFRELGITVDIYVPDRMLEGYGPLPGSINKIKNNGADLVITVDCGTAAHEALNEAKKIGLDVIVIDHHVSIEVPTQAVAVINPNRIDETSDCTYLAAVGVTFLFVTALITKLREDNYFQTRTSPNILNHLGLVALGTVCDVMPITKLNRVFVAQGLKMIQKNYNVGIKALFDIAMIDEPPSSYHLGYIIGPRINAGGRIGKSDLGAALLATSDHFEASKLANILNDYNKQRQFIESLIFEEALKIAEAQQDEKLLFIAGQGWHVGVIGIVAGKLKEKFSKAVAVITINDGIAKASCRSVKNINFGIKIIEAKNLELLVSGGGHAMAAGFTAYENRLPELKEYLTQSFKQDFMKASSHDDDEFDAELTTSSITPQLIQELKQLEPYGVGNPAPIFKFSDLFVLKADIVGEKHIRCILAPQRDSYGSKPLAAIAFDGVNNSFREALLSKRAHSISAIGSLKTNVWQGTEKIQLQIKDIIVNK